MKYAIKRLGVNNLNGDPTWITTGLRVLETGIIPDGFEEITKSNYKKEIILQGNEYEDWYKSIHQTPLQVLSEKDFSDYKQARKEAKRLLTEAGGFSSLSEYEKSKACDWFICTPDEMVNHYTNTIGLTQEQAINKLTENAEIFDTKSREARATRYRKAFIYIRNAITETDAIAVGQDLITFQLEKSYVDYGREGTELADGSPNVNYKGVVDQPGLFDYVLGTQTWTDLSYPNFESRISQALYGSTTTGIIDRLMNILEKGIY